MSFKVSIIIPIFNAEESLEKSIESIINQTIGFESLGTNSQPRNIEIYMGETSVSSFGSTATSEFVPVDQLELVYSGVWNITAGWQMFHL